jgi:hypothetical protein
MNKRRKKKLEINTPHKNKYAKFSQAEKIAAELDQLEKKVQQPTTLPSRQTPPSRPTEPTRHLSTQTYRCIADLYFKTPQQARECHNYTSPNKCSSKWSIGEICTVIRDSQI